MKLTTEEIDAILDALNYQRNTILDTDAMEPDAAKERAAELAALMRKLRTM